MAGKDHAAKAAAEAKKQYDSVKTGGESLSALVAAVKKAQVAKTNNKKLSKKELKNRLIALKQQAKADADALEAKKTQAAADALEAARLAQQAKDDQIAADKALRRETRLKAVEEGRKRQQAQIIKVKQLKRAVDVALKTAQAGAIDEKRIRDLIMMQNNLKAAWSALPTRFHNETDREAIILNDKIIEDLKEIVKADKAEADSKKEKVADAQEAKSSSKDTLSRSLALAAALLGGAGRLASRGGAAVSEAGGRAGSFISTSSSRGLVLAKKLVDNTGAISTHVAALGHDSKEWFAKKFGGMFSKLWRLVRNPGDMLKKAPSLLSKALGWGALFTSVIAPIIKGLYDELSSKFSVDYIKEKFNETKEWLYNKITTWFEAVFDFGKKNVVDPLVNKAGETVQAGATKLDVGPKSDEQKANIEALKAQPLKDTPELTKLRASYGLYKETGNGFTKFLAKSSVTADLNALKKKGEVIPADFAAKLDADGFDTTGAKIGIGKSNSKSPVVAAPAAPSAKASVPTVAGAPADGAGTTKPVTATPKPMTSSLDSGGSFSAGSSPGGLAVSQVPNSVIDDSSHGYNTGVLTGY